MSLIKRNEISKLIERAHYSHNKGFYLQSIWIYYAIIDSRINKTLILLGEPLTKADGSHLNLQEKLQQVKDLFIAGNALLISAKYKEIDFNVKNWIIDRNKLTHELWSKNRAWEKYQNYLSHLSNKGDVYMLQWVDAVKRLKKRVKARAKQKH